MSAVVGENVFGLDVLVQDGRLEIVEVFETGGDVVGELPDYAFVDLADHLCGRSFGAVFHCEEWPVLPDAEEVGGEEVFVGEAESDSVFVLELFLSACVEREV